MTELIISNTAIRQLGGLYSLNDLHRAAGGEKRHEPNRFMRLDSTHGLITAIGNSPEVGSFQITEGRNGGTYVCRELVYAYAMWISPAFHLQVIRAYDALATGGHPALINELGPLVRSQIGGIVKAIVHKEVVEAIRELVPSMVQGYLAGQQTSIRRGLTAGQIWHTFGLPRIKNGAVLLSNRLEAFGCLVEGCGRAEMGGRTAKLFDPDKAAKAMKSGLLDFCKRYVQERRGQQSLNLVVMPTKAGADA